MTDLPVRVLVTGGASEIGMVIAKRFHLAGFRVFVCDLSREAIDRMTNDFSGVAGAVANVGCEWDVKRLFAEARKCLGDLDVLVNNAGIAGPTAPVEETTLTDWQRNPPDVERRGAAARHRACGRRAQPHPDDRRLAHARPAVRAHSSVRQQGHLVSFHYANPVST